MSSEVVTLLYYISMRSEVITLRFWWNAIAGSDNVRRWLPRTIVKTTSGATGSRWEEGQRAWPSDASTSFIRSEIDRKVILPRRACAFRSIGSSRKAEGCRGKSRRLKASRCWSRRSKASRCWRSKIRRSKRSGVQIRRS